MIMSIIPLFHNHRETGPFLLSTLPLLIVDISYTCPIRRNRFRRTLQTCGENRSLLKNKIKSRHQTSGLTSTHQIWQSNGYKAPGKLHYSNDKLSNFCISNLQTASVCPPLVFPVEWRAGAGLLSRPRRGPRWWGRGSRKLPPSREGAAWSQSRPSSQIWPCQSRAWTWYADNRTSFEFLVWVSLALHSQ